MSESGPGGEAAADAARKGKESAKKILEGAKKFSGRVPKVCTAHDNVAPPSSLHSSHLPQL